MDPKSNMKQDVFFGSVGTKIRTGSIPKTINMTGWKYYSFVGLLIGFTGMMLYPILVDPILHLDKYKKIHEEVQTELFQAGVLPGQLKKWDDLHKR